MGFISDISTEVKTSISFYSKGQTVTNGQIQPASYSLVGAAVDGLFWTGGKSVTFYSDKLKTRVDAVVAVDYLAAFAAIKDDGRVVANGLNYQILHIENVGQQNEVLEVPIQREKTNG